MHIDVSTETPRTSDRGLKQEPVTTVSLSGELGDLFLAGAFLESEGQMKYPC